MLLHESFVQLQTKVSHAKVSEFPKQYKYLKISFYCCLWYNDVTDIEVKEVCIISPESPVSPD
jgi:hypothetical protein